MPILTSRSALRATHLLHTPESFVRTPMPGLVGGQAIIHADPSLGANFLWYTAELAPGGALPTSANSRLLYVLSGKIVNGRAPSVGPDTFAYSLPAVPYSVTAVTAARVIVIEKAYEPLHGVAQIQTFAAREADLVGGTLAGTDIAVRMLIPPDDPQYDFAVNTMTYPPHAALAQVEVHYMEHGLLMLEGSGLYVLDGCEYQVQAGDFIWMKAYCPQWFQAGAHGAKYLIYKNFNRAPRL